MELDTRLGAVCCAPPPNFFFNDETATTTRVLPQSLKDEKGEEGLGE